MAAFFPPSSSSAGLIQRLGVELVQIDEQSLAARVERHEPRAEDGRGLELGGLHGDLEKLLVAGADELHLRSSGRLLAAATNQ